MMSPAEAAVLLTPQERGIEPDEHLDFFEQEEEQVSARVVDWAEVQRVYDEWRDQPTGNPDREMFKRVWFYSNPEDGYWTIDVQTVNGLKYSICNLDDLASEINPAFLKQMEGILCWLGAKAMKQILAKTGE